ncbi:MAG: hypothetical protein Q9195_008181 [Heterodermia aff. obscurata]
MFAWLSHLRGPDDSPILPVVTFEDIMDEVQQWVNIKKHFTSANDYLKSCSEIIGSFDDWIRIFLAHPYFSSLWTLQELILRNDAWILLDDGLLPRLPTPLLIDHDIDSTFTAIRSRERWIRKAEKIVRAGHKIPEYTYETIHDRLTKLRQLRECKALDVYWTQNMHSAYSLAQHRNASRLTDRIYGIVQTYDISCDPDPKGDTEAAKLHALEDEFGMKLVAKSGFVSQLFIHNSSPRRSWLITPQCTISPRWKSFSDRERVTEEKASLVVSEQTKDLEICGRAWHLVSLLDSRSTKEQAMILDDHVAKEVLGQTVDHFRDRRSMREAGERLFRRYGRSIRVVLLASATFLSGKEYIGILVTPLGAFEESPPWVRIGLFWWEENFRLAHKDIPVPNHGFQCLIK